MSGWTHRSCSMRRVDEGAGGPLGQRECGGRIRMKYPRCESCGFSVPAVYHEKTHCQTCLRVNKVRISAERRMFHATKLYCAPTTPGNDANR
jgi:hypothetical protein